MISAVFDRRSFILPMKDTFNGDVKVAAYLPAQLTATGRKRSGIHEPMGDCVRFDEHIRRASLKGGSPFAAETPIPAETLDADRSIREMPSDRLVLFLDDQLNSPWKVSI